MGALYRVPLRRIDFHANGSARMTFDQFSTSIVLQAKQQSTLEIIAFVFGILCVWQYVRENPWAWVTGTVQCVMQMYLFYHIGLFAESALQVVYVITNIYGLYVWLYGGEKKDELKVSRVARPTALILAAACGLGFFTMLKLLQHLGRDPQTLWLDALTTAIYLTAQIMLTRKWIENWPVWIIGNLLTIPLFLMKELYFLTVMQPIFIALSIRGWMRWHKELNAGCGKSLSHEPVQKADVSHRA
jgi:nicotinamide mononucleotide transporter